MDRLAKEFFAAKGLEQFPAERRRSQWWTSVCQELEPAPTREEKRWLRATYVADPVHLEAVVRTFLPVSEREERAAAERLDELERRLSRLEEKFASQRAFSRGAPRAYDGPLDGFELPDEASVRAFLGGRSELVNALRYGRQAVKEIFGADATVKLRVRRRPEHRILLCVVTSLPAQEASLRMEQLGNEWGIQALVTFEDQLGIALEFAGV